MKGKLSGKISNAYYGGMGRLDIAMKQHPRVAALAVGAAASLLSLNAMAQAVANPAGLGGIFTNFNTLVQQGLSAAAYGAYAGGMVSTYVGINNAIKKSKGDHQVTPGAIFGYGLGGPALMVGTYIADSAATSVGGAQGAATMGAGGALPPALPPA